MPGQIATRLGPCPAYPLSKRVDWIAAYVREADGGPVVSAAELAHEGSLDPERLCGAALDSALRRRGIRARMYWPGGGGGPFVVFEVIR